MNTILHKVTLSTPYITMHRKHATNGLIVHTSFSFLLHTCNGMQRSAWVVDLELRACFFHCSKMSHVESYQYKPKVSVCPTDSLVQGHGQCRNVDSEDNGGIYKLVGWWHIFDMWSKNKYFYVRHLATYSLSKLYNICQQATTYYMSHN